MKLLLLNIILLSSSLYSSNESLFTTNFIGLSKDELSKVIIDKHRSFKLNTGNNNSSFNYAKFVDSLNEITVLFFLTDKDECKAVRIISDYSNINDIISQLNENYTNIKTGEWKYEDNKKEYHVNLKEGEWFFTVSIKEIVE